MTKLANEELIMVNVLTNKPKELKELIERTRWNIDFIYGGWSPLIWAIVLKHNEIVKILIKLGVSQDFTSKDKRTPLIWAVISKNDKAIKLLDNTTINCFDKEGKTALIWVTQLGNLEIVKELVNRGANKGFPDKYHYIALHYSAIYCNREIEEFLSSK